MSLIRQGMASCQAGWEEGVSYPVLVSAAVGGHPGNLWCPGMYKSHTVGGCPAPESPFSRNSCPSLCAGLKT